MAKPEEIIVGEFYKVTCKEFQDNVILIISDEVRGRSHLRRYRLIMACTGSEKVNYVGMFNIHSPFGESLIKL